MSVEVFTVQPPADIGILPLVILVITGVIILVLSFATGRRAKMVRQTFVIMVIMGIALIGLGVWLYYSTQVNSTITLGSGYMSIQSSSFGGTGDMNITTGEITDAYIAHIGSGNLTLSKQHGSNLGNYNVGVFTIGNGATAYVVSNNSTDLIIHLNTGNYLILGTSNTNALALGFSQLVYPIQG
jgi:hypothetical protein